MGLAVLGMLLLAALVLGWRGRRRGAQALLLAALGVLLAIGTGPLPQTLLDALQSPYDSRVEGPWAQRNAIVLLGAGTAVPPDAPLEPTVYAYGRIARAAALYRQCKAAAPDCKLLVTGGDPLHHGRSEAAVYADLLTRLGVPAADLMLEPRSLSTWQNAQFSRPLLLAYAPQRVLLVSSALHLRRALVYFAHFGIHPEPVRADLLRAAPSWLPVGWNVTVFDSAVHELLGLARYRIYNTLGWNALPVASPAIPATR
ncbi:YdcF family protein [Dyella sp.]|jgi:uncharacterized SAM-binding protein YcdF (DUF218 family)|uniref:YdcF family protein n=1 Tax=Dyella sp. TaxID=1869338 RepID=UPI002D792DBA|nr:YdcF family protein [Dyella sp.]HET6431036.1 YdcF family protein [Dyella sp.]